MNLIWNVQQNKQLANEMRCNRNFYSNSNLNSICWNGKYKYKTWNKITSSSKTRSTTKMSRTNEDKQSETFVCLFFGGSVYIYPSDGRLILPVECRANVSCIKCQKVLWLLLWFAAMRIKPLDNCSKHQSKYLKDTLCKSAATQWTPVSLFWLETFQADTKNLVFDWVAWRVHLFRTFQW